MIVSLRKFKNKPNQHRWVWTELLTATWPSKSPQFVDHSVDWIFDDEVSSSEGKLLQMMMLDEVVPEKSRGGWCAKIYGAVING